MYIYINKSGNVLISMHIYIYIGHVLICMHIYIYIYVYIHTCIEQRIIRGSWAIGAQLLKAD